MQTVVGVRFKKPGKIYYFDPGDLEIAAGDNCIVETARGIEFGEVVVLPNKLTTAKYNLSKKLFAQQRLKTKKGQQS